MKILYRHGKYSKWKGPVSVDDPKGETRKEKLNDIQKQLNDVEIVEFKII